MRLWWNWQTRYFEVVVAKAVQVQVLLSAPFFRFSLIPEGRPENSPAIYRRVHWFCGPSSAGTAEPFSRQTSVVPPGRISGGLGFPAINRRAIFICSYGTRPRTPFPHSPPQRQFESAPTSNHTRRIAIQLFPAWSAVTLAKEAAHFCVAFADGILHPCHPRNPWLNSGWGRGILR